MALVHGSGCRWSLPVRWWTPPRSSGELDMAARTKSKIPPKYKTKYRIENWPAYEASLRKRGDITIWFDEAAVAAWNAPASGLPGGQRRYSDLAIITALTLRTVYHLPLRQTEGFVASLIRLIGLGLDTPDHTTLSRRGQSVAVPQFATTPDGPIHLVIDSTGLKMVGDGEWHVAKHKTTNKRRTWRQLHLGVDGSGFIVASRLTESGSSDSTIGVQMVEGLAVSVNRFVDNPYTRGPVCTGSLPARRAGRQSACRGGGEHLLGRLMPAPPGARRSSAVHQVGCSLRCTPGKVQDRG